MDDAGRVHVFQTSEDLVQEVLDELFFKGAGGEQSVEIGTEELCHKVADPVSIRRQKRRLHVFERGDENVAEGDDLLSAGDRATELGMTHVLVSQVFQELQLSVGSLGQDRGGEGLHDLLDGNRGTRQLILGRAMRGKRENNKRHRRWEKRSQLRDPTRARATYQTRPKAPIPTGWRST